MQLSAQEALRQGQEETAAAIAGKEGELGSRLVKGLNDREQRRVEALLPEIKEIKERLLIAQNARMEVRTRG